MLYVTFFLLSLHKKQKVRKIHPTHLPQPLNCLRASCSLTVPAQNAHWDGNGFKSEATVLFWVLVDLFADEFVGLFAFLFPVESEERDVSVSSTGRLFSFVLAMVLLTQAGGRFMSLFFDRKDPVDTDGREEPCLKTVEPWTLKLEELFCSTEFSYS